MTIISPLLRIAACILLAASALTVHSQELNCDVDVNTSAIQGTNTSIFESFKENVREYLNNTKFSSAQFAPNEKINCKILFTITEFKDNSEMIGDLQIQASRPVYNSSYTTPVINFRDTNIDFTYSDGQVLTHTEGIWDSQLTAILDYYANLVLAMDFDSFSPRGGEPFWEQIGGIVQMGQSSGESGWKAFEDNKNRAAVYTAFTQPSTSVLRDINYEYHRKGLDEMTVSPDKGRAAITKAMENLDKVFKLAPMSVGLSMFKDAKLDEIVNLYTKSSTTERQSVYELMQRLYPTETRRLDMLKKGVNK